MTRDQQGQQERSGGARDPARPRTRVPRERRERAVRLVREHRREDPSEGAAITSIATKLGASPETVRHRVRRAEVDDGRRPGGTSGRHDRGA